MCNGGTRRIASLAVGDVSEMEHLFGFSCRRRNAGLDFEGQTMITLPSTTDLSAEIIHSLFYYVVTT